MSAAARLGRRLLGGALELGLAGAEAIHVIGTLSAARAGRHRSGRGAPPRTAPLTAILCRAERSLAENVLPFWARHAPDEEWGGFITHLGRTGDRLGTTDKYLVAQARMIWTLAAAHRHGLSDRGYLDLAGRGVRFLVDRVWDPTHGGFVWAVTRDGSPLDPRKSVYGQAFAIYGLAEYAMAAGDPQALAWAGRAFDVLVAKAGDGALGFREEFAREWTPAAGWRGERKTLNTHLHLMEALVSLTEASRRETHAQALRGVLDLLLTRAVHARHGYAWDEFDPAWQARVLPRRQRHISYGHNVELAWLSLRAIGMLGLPREPARGPILDLIDHALAYGFDHTRGGLAQYGPPAGAVRHAVYLPVERLTRVWWQQAEMLVAALEAYRWTGAARYRVAFEKQFDWIWRYQTDHDGGDWYEATAWRDGRPLRLDKGHAWKDPYHNARALMEVSRQIRALGAEVE
ncbi:MAG TPA: AGE family epimerase/isomerase [bacterium]|nr:AGE family epimerase/isomerase [bacterium]